MPQSHEDTELLGLNALTQRIIGCAIEVHRVLGPGLLEPIYEAAMCIEMDDVGIAYERQIALPAFYKGRPLGRYRIDLTSMTSPLSKSRVSSEPIRCSRPRC